MGEQGDEEGVVAGSEKLTAADYHISHHNVAEVPLNGGSSEIDALTDILGGLFLGTTEGDDGARGD